MPCTILPRNTTLPHRGLSMDAKERLYLVRWLDDNEPAVMSGFQLEAVLHHERKEGVVYLSVLRTATWENIDAHPAADDREYAERDRCVKAMLKRGELKARA